MPTILFVCTANRFRSPIAAARFRKELAQSNSQEKWQIASAGTWTTDGLQATSAAILGAKRLGLDINDHRSRSITEQSMHDADLIIVMEEGQKEALEIEFPESAKKVHLLSEGATGVSYDIPDPSQSYAADEIYSEIDELIRKGFERLCALVR